MRERTANIVVAVSSDDDQTDIDMETETDSPGARRCFRKRCSFQGED